MSKGQANATTASRDPAHAGEGARPQDDVDVVIDGMAYGGKGVGRIGEPPGKVLFVENGIEGDHLRARITHDSGRYADAEIVEVLQPSPLRGTPACPYALECGGCQWQGIAYEQQLEWKRHFVIAALTRIAKLPPETPVTILPSPATLEYRNRILVRAHHENGETLKLGYFARASRRLVPIDRCAIADPAINQTLSEIAAIEARDLPAFKARLEIQALPSAQTVITVYPAEGPREAMDAWIARLATRPVVQWAGLVFDLPKAPTVVYDEDLDLSFRTIPGQFQQVNLALNHTLRRLVKSEVEKRAPRRVLDVFCGSGNLSLPLADGSRYIEGIEFNKKAIVVAHRNAEAHDLHHLNYLAGDAEKHLWKCARGGESFDLVILDPPRQGMHKGMVPLKMLAPATIIYVSCDPTTLARDLGYLCRKGEYTITSITALDFFPNTYHVETVAVLERTTSSEAKTSPNDGSSDGSKKTP